MKNNQAGNFTYSDFSMLTEALRKRYASLMTTGRIIGKLDIAEAILTTLITDKDNPSSNPEDPNTILRGILKNIDHLRGNTLYVAERRVSSGIN